MPYSRRFEDPIPGAQTLKDAANLILKLPKSEQSKEHWQTAAEAVRLAAENIGPLLHAEIGMRRAMNFGKARPERVRVRKPLTIITNKKPGATNEGRPG